MALARIVTFLCVLILATTSHASPITYSIFTYASGVLNGSTFTNQLVTIRYFGDTAGLTTAGTSIIEPFGATGVDVQGLGSDLLTDSTFFFVDNATLTAGIYDSSTATSIDVIAPEFGTYSAAAALGPILGSFYSSPGASLATAHGSFTLSSYFPVAGFEAQLAPVPEPSTLVLLLTGGPWLLTSLSRRRSA
jgi:hypothetical protein